MLKLKAVRFQNMFSFGNEMTEIKLDSKAPTLCIGKNGAGKSSAILDCVMFALFNKPFKKINRGQIVNTITNRDAVVELDFETGGHQFMVRRGLKPNLFEIFKNGDPVQQPPSVKEFQEWFEKEIIRVNLKTCTQIVFMGTGNYMPFMQLPAAQRREVIEDILDIQVFGTMNQVLKERIDAAKTKLADIEKRLAIVQREKQVVELHIISAQKDVDGMIEQKKQKAISYATEAKEADTAVQKLDVEIANLRSSLVDVAQNSSRLMSITVDLRDIESQMSRLSKEHRFYHDNDTCPTCQQGIAHDLKQQKTDGIEAETKLLDARKQELNAELAELKAGDQKDQQHNAKINQMLLTLEKEKRSHENVARTARSFIQSLKDEVIALKREKITKAEDGRLEALQIDLEAIDKERSEAQKEMDLMSVASELLKDGGVKAKIVAQYIPAMNTLVNKYLAAMESFVDFHLDEEFNETIRSRYRDTFTYGSFSQGEKLRIDLAIMFAWRDIAKHRNSASVSLLVFDEILDSSLDIEGVEYFMKLIMNITEDTSVFVVSHRGEQMADKFQHVLRFEKNQSFSKVAVVG